MNEADKKLAQEDFRRFCDKHDPKGELEQDSLNEAYWEACETGTWEPYHWRKGG